MIKHSEVLTYKGAKVRVVYTLTPAEPDVDVGANVEILDLEILDPDSIYVNYDQAYEDIKAELYEDLIG